ncbi:MAG: MATE family efflux transporter [Phycisphaerae bacterium]|nr:MATE family efflux transporter [Phycisphaerae bacterium]
MNSAPQQPHQQATLPSQTSELRMVLRIALPMVVTMSTHMVMDVSDYIMVSWVSSNAQAALVPAQLTIFAYVALGMGTLSLVNTVVAQSFGQKNYTDCSAFTWQGLYLTGIFAALGCLLWLVLPGLFRSLGHDPGVQALELAYTQVGVLTIGPALAPVALCGFFTGIQRPLTTMWSAIEAVVVNAAVSYCLIFGMWGFPEMGIVGAAYGTLTGGCYRTVRLVITMCLPSHHQRFNSRHTWGFDWPKVKIILRVGIPSGLQWFSDIVVWWVFVNILVGKLFGTVHLIASNTAWQYMRVVFMPCIGMGIAVTSLVGEAIGRGDRKEAIRLTRITVLLTGGYAGFFSLVYLCLGGWLMSLLSDIPEVIRIGTGVLVCAAAFQLLDGVGIAYEGALRGAGDTFWPSILFVISHWLILIGGGSTMAYWKPQWGSLGPWIAAATLLVFIGLAMWWRWQSGKWMSIDLFKGQRQGIA